MFLEAWATAQSSHYYHRSPAEAFFRKCNHLSGPVFTSICYRRVEQNSFHKFKVVIIFDVILADTDSLLCAKTVQLTIRYN